MYKYTGNLLLLQRVDNGTKLLNFDVLDLEINILLLNMIVLSWLYVAELTAEVDLEVDFRW